MEDSAEVRQPYSLINQGVAWWHVLLGAVALLNLVLWTMAAAAVIRASAALPAAAVFACELQLLLCAGYVLGCAYRSVLPVFDIPRIVLIDSPLSSVMVGRSVATIAEVCFAAQWAVMLHHIAFLTESPFAQAVALGILPLVLVAEVFSWNSVLTTDQRGHMVENSLWGLAAALVVASIVMIGPHQLAGLYPLMISWVIGGTAYASFIVFFDVPMYRTRWLADEKGGRRYFSITDGIVDARVRRAVSYQWDVWKSELLWMSLYFSFGVWSSISLVYASLALSHV